MRRHGNPALLGLFVVGALVLLFATVFTVAGGRLFATRQQVVMYFSGSIYGLQVGAPVVFRGVRLGSVSSVGVKWDAAGHHVSIPVVAELDADALRNVGGGSADANLRATVQTLVGSGLRAQLAMQSILTGQLYIDLDFRPDKPSMSQGGTGQPEIPTVATVFQELRNQIDQIDVKRLIEDIGAIASTTRAMVSAPELSRALKDLDDITRHLVNLSQRLDQRSGPLLDRAEATLDAARKTTEDLRVAASAVTDSARRVGTTFQPDGALATKLRGAADEMARTGVVLRESVGTDAPLNRDLQRALTDLASAARSLRELADTLNQQPESVLRGRQ
ncbi:MCE family protein [Ideonella sp. 4Y16]|uniref:MCE family protein n=1 Tax=Ideonella alba TaxID=2824118 RepID=A0A940YKK8_9BURK|nr:MCE family protein [Ideonella alba]MBQ0943835.1 MCE family protein [Ideonella alba]